MIPEAIRQRLTSTRASAVRVTTAPIGQAIRLGAALITTAAVVFLVYRMLFYAWMSATPERDARDWGALALRDGAVCVAIISAWLFRFWRRRQNRSRPHSPEGARSQPRP